MPSSAHQSACSLACAQNGTRTATSSRVMTDQRRRVVYWNRLPIPFEIAAVRPDVFGICTQSGRIAVGEAKTAEDVFTRHTVQQLRVLGHLRDHRTGELCAFYIAVPRSAT